jgi:hypothetical protein|nr:MAG TPA: cellulase [Herelleviridae sp.]
MAKAAWLTVNPASGNGNATVQNIGTVHTGREQRETTVTGVAVGVSPNKTYKVIQKGKPEFVSFTNGAETTVGKAGGTLTITGKTNSSKLNFELVDLETRVVVEGGLKLTLPSKYTAGGVETTNNVAITGDPGAQQEFEFSITFTGIAANTTIDELTAAMKVTTAGGRSVQIQIKQSAGDPVFSFGQETITLEASGVAVSQTIVSNTSWELS